MAVINENDLSSMLSDNFKLRAVEPYLYSVFTNNEFGNEYDTQFGFIYDWVACNPIYNRLLWGYSIEIFPLITNEALNSAQFGSVLDIGCGSLTFTAKTYIQYSERPVILMDQSLKMLRMGKARLIKQNGSVPKNLIFLHANALQLPFKENSFTTIHSENLLHCLHDTGILLNQVKTVLSSNGKMYFTTLVKTNRCGDKYLGALAKNGKLISRTVNDHKDVFDRCGLSAKYDTTGNILVIHCTKM